MRFVCVFRRPTSLSGSALHAQSDRAWSRFKGWGSLFVCCFCVTLVLYMVQKNVSNNDEISELTGNVLAWHALLMQISQMLQKPHTYTTNEQYPRGCFLAATQLVRLGLPQTAFTFFVCSYIRKFLFAKCGKGLLLFVYGYRHRLFLSPPPIPHACPNGNVDHTSKMRTRWGVTALIGQMLSEWAIGQKGDWKLFL